MSASSNEIVADGETCSDHPQGVKQEPSKDEADGSGSAIPSGTELLLQQQGCWRDFLFILEDTDDLEISKEIHRTLWFIEKYDMTKTLLGPLGIGIMVSLILSTSLSVGKTGMRIAAATLPLSFAALFAGMILNLLLLQLLGIGLGIIAFSSAVFSFLRGGLKCIPVVTGVVCVGILVIPISALVSHKIEKYEEYMKRA